MAANQNPWFRCCSFVPRVVCVMKGNIIRRASLFYPVCVPRLFDIVSLLVLEAGGREVSASVATPTHRADATYVGLRLCRTDASTRHPRALHRRSMKTRVRAGGGGCICLLFRLVDRCPNLRWRLGETTRGRRVWRSMAMPGEQNSRARTVVEQFVGSASRERRG